MKDYQSSAAMLYYVLPQKVMRQHLVYSMFESCPTKKVFVTCINYLQVDRKTCYLFYSRDIQTFYHVHYIKSVIHMCDKVYFGIAYLVYD